jgi:hypothetical protein
MLTCGTDNGRLSALPGPVMSYRAVDSAGYDVHNEPLNKLKSWLHLQTGSPNSLR